MLMAKVKEDSQWNPVTACAGQEFVKREYRSVPVGLEEEAKVNPFLKTMDAEAEAKEKAKVAKAAKAKAAREKKAKAKAKAKAEAEAEAKAEAEAEAELPSEEPAEEKP